MLLNLLQIFNIKMLHGYIYISGKLLPVLTQHVNARVFSGDKKNIAVNPFSNLVWELVL